MALFEIKNGGLRYLEFCLDGILVTYSDLSCYFVPTYKIWAKYLNPGWSYGYICKIQDGGRPSFWNYNHVI